jgi:ribosomal silencing factor RsfS
MRRVCNRGIAYISKQVVHSNASSFSLSCSTRSSSLPKQGHALTLRAQLHSCQGLRLFSTDTDTAEPATQEQKRERRREYARQYYAANKERLVRQSRLNRRKQLLAEGFELRSKFGIRDVLDYMQEHDEYVQDLRVYDIAAQKTFTDYFVVATCSSMRVMQFLSNNVYQHSKALGNRKTRNECVSLDDDEWMIVDFGGVWVHLLSEGGREKWGPELEEPHTACLIPPEDHATFKHDTKRKAVVEVSALRRFDDPYPSDDEEGEMDGQAHALLEEFETFRRVLSEKRASAAEEAKKEAGVSLNVKKRQKKKKDWIPKKNAALRRDTLRS